MKNGVKTTEFWLTILVDLSSAIASVINPEVYGKWGIIAAGIATAVYTIGRSQVKKANSR